jgi:hypothetical protein
MEVVLEASRQIRSLNHLRDTVIGAQLDEELYESVCVEESRNLLRTVLIESYFAARCATWTAGTRTDQRRGISVQPGAS